MTERGAELVRRMMFFALAGCRAPFMQLRCRLRRPEAGLCVEGVMRNE